MIKDIACITCYWLDVDHILPIDLFRQSCQLKLQESSRYLNHKAERDLTLLQKYMAVFQEQLTLLY